ncbi:hypothetical protein C0J52_14637 [Blattella germanica]|nr:hypothetical protein C0J52_14637 [Blattella germanica]
MNGLCAGAGVSLNELKNNRNEHRGRHNHNKHKHGGGQSIEDSTAEPTTPPPEVDERKEDFDNACCSRQEKYVAIGFEIQTLNPITSPSNPHPELRRRFF